MDKKNLTIGLLLLAAAAAILIWNSSHPPPPPVRPPAPQTATANPPATATPSDQSAIHNPQSAISSAAATSPNGLVTETADAQITTLSNDFIAARFTNHGGAIVDIAFTGKQTVRGQPRLLYPAALDSSAPFVFNEQHTDPIFAFATDAFTAAKLDRDATYKLVSKTPTEVVFSAIVENGADRFEVKRRYSIDPADPARKLGDPYIIRHEVTFTNLTDHALPLPAFAFNIGTVALVSDNSQRGSYGLFLTGASNNGDATSFIYHTDLKGGSGFLGMNPTPPVPYKTAPGKTLWAAVGNQFFTGILTPDAPGAGMVTRRVDGLTIPGTRTPVDGLSVALDFAAPALAPNASATLGFDYYAGPKEYNRLRHFRQNQDNVMLYSSNLYKRIMFSWFFSPMMNTLMNYMHRFLGNWGLAIIAMTLLFKIVTIPLTLSASRSARRMQKVQPELQAAKEKYKDNPQAQQKATMEIFKKHKINPMSSCIPMLITMPLFAAFFFMLPSAAELRFQPFLWAHDLSAPDTIAHIFGLPINIFPLLASGAMMLQMWLVPTPATTTGGSNTQMMIMKWGMPIMMFFFYQTFSCALALYSTVNGVFMVCQQLVINRLQDTGDPADPANKNAPASAGGAAFVRTPVASKGARPMKNVTPRKKT